jgi:gamma-glutamylcyclotransferase (GGCT)/AIG2-like uncharacterized protein YtfP
MERKGMNTLLQRFQNEAASKGLVGTDAQNYAEGAMKKHLSERNTLFVYGTLRKKHTDYQALGNHDVMRSPNATLRGFKNVNMGQGYHTIKADPGGMVYGKALELKNPGTDLPKLDQYEDRYNRIPVTLDDGTLAHAYQMKGTAS